MTVIRVIRSHQGLREDLGISVRSSWEANYCRYLNLLKAQGQIAGWEYEPKTFWFEAIRRGVRSYLPDFRVTFPDGHHEWHEVKGWMDPKSRTKLNRMRIYYPKEQMVVIDRAWFRQAEKTGLSGVIPHWERPATATRRSA